jgi:23S rRNA (uridine2552-2'-O)-methyltransferase
MPKRTNSSARWLNEHANDFYVKQAKKEGYRSRAAFKLLEIQSRDHLLKSGMLVVDLGAAPGGWSAVAKQKVGETGRVIAVDILPMPPLPGVECIQGDFYLDEVLVVMMQHIENCAVDLVMSDMSPNITGINIVDQARAYDLSEHALLFAQQVLKPNGSFLIKVFQGQGFEVFLKQIRACFSKVNIRKPNASRGRSQEVYIVSTGYIPLAF